MDNADRAGAPLYISQKLVQQLYKTPSQLGRDIYAAMLKDLCSTFEDVEKEAVNWLIHSEDEVCGGVIIDHLPKAHLGL